MKIEIGKIYKVEIEDCCVDGRFISKLIKAQIHNDDDVLQPAEKMEYGVVLTFENGVVLCGMGGVSLEEIN